MDRDNKENAANAADYDMEKPVDWDGFRDNEVDYSSKEFNALESLQNIQKPEVIGKCVIHDVLSHCHVQTDILLIHYLHRLVHGYCCSSKRCFTCLRI